MKTIEKLINSDRNRKIGNHRLEIQGNKRLYYYHDTAIIVTTPIGIFIDNGGWNTRSTNRAINVYLKHLSNNNIIDRRMD